MDLAWAVLLTLRMERRLQQIEAPADEGQTGGTGEPGPPRHRLLQQDEDGDGRNPHEVHDAAHEEEAHQGPAAPPAVAAVMEPHAEGAPGPFTPTGEEEAQRGLAVCEAGVLPRRELVAPGQDQEAAPQEAAGGRQMRRG